MVIQNCKPATLTKINIVIDIWRYGQPVDQTVLDESMPFFSNLRELKLTVRNSDESIRKEFQRLLNIITLSAKNLEFIDVRDLVIAGDWLKNMTNLRQLHITWENSSSYDDLISCLKRNPKLKVFNVEYYRDEQNDLTNIGDVLSELCPFLEYFGECRDECHSMETELPTMDRYKFLSKFSYLNRVSLTTNTYCGSDLYYALKSLAGKDIVELKLIFSINEVSVMLDEDVTTDFMSRPLPEFNSLQTVEITTALIVCDIDENFKFLKFLFNFMKQLKNLKTIKFAWSELGYINDKVLEFAQSIDTLDLSSVSIPYEEIICIVEKLRKIRKHNNDRQLLKLKLYCEEFDKVSKIKKLAKGCMHIQHDPYFLWRVQSRNFLVYSVLQYVQYD